jgi:hypothetical protein
MLWLIVLYNLIHALELGGQKHDMVVGKVEEVKKMSLHMVADIGVHHT